MCECGVPRWLRPQVGVGQGSGSTEGGIRADHPVLAGDGPRAGHLGHAQKRTCGKSPKTWPELDPHRVSEVLKADHPDANRPRAGLSCAQ